MAYDYQRIQNEWRKLDEKVGVAFQRYNYTVSGKFGDLYGREYNFATGKFDGEYFLLTYPVRFGTLFYFVTKENPMVYKLDERTGKYRESKTAYKAIQRCEAAINRAIDRREECSEVRGSRWQTYTC